MKMVAGLDGGGTKTTVTLADESGVVRHLFSAGPLNVNGQDAESVHRTVADICAEIDGASPGGIGECAALCVGAAGISNPAVSGLLTAGLRAGGFAGELVLVGDHVTALSGALEGGPGAIVIAGTGSIAYGRNGSGQTHRAGGFGHLIDDGGSGYSLGRDLLAAVVRSSDGREEPTVMADLVYRELDISSMPELIGFVYDKSRGKKEIAALAPLVFQACESGDLAALRIVRDNADALAATASAVVSRLALQSGELALLGSVLTMSQRMRDAFQERMSWREPLVRCIEPKRDTSYGAVLLALKALRG
ncbi:BadF/BadG/BcrA/BcrD ATPase family protein [Paenibacillus sp. PL2-23]|uniref:N-acetylglucosamine kinase n=1 Tax=Paenibacillus sp. PL2-23 TaxID=2100729 RepID=UPI0030F612B2